jgi:hypothetical protein
MRIVYLFTAILIALPAFAQKYEFGVQGGISFYDKKTVTNPRGSADAGFKLGYAAGFTIGHNMYQHIGGEIRYTFLQNEMKLNSGSTEATFASQAHVIHYDLLIHSKGPDSPVRPYVAVGGGMKYYRGTGAEQPFQPLSNIAILTKTSETKGLASVGGGVKLKMTDKIWLRFDVHDYLTPFPKHVITPNEGSAAGGWMNNIVGTCGITFTI